MSTIADILQVGDLVEINIPDTERSEEYPRDFPPNGSRGRVRSFSTYFVGRTSGRKYPGFYEDRYRCMLWVGEGDRNNIEIKTLHLTYVEADVQKKREEDFLAFNNKPEEAKHKISDLPDTPFWEDDIVKLKPEVAQSIKEYYPGFEVESHFTVRSIRYEAIGKILVVDGRNIAEPCYKLEYKNKVDPSFPSPFLSEDQLTLVARGYVWQVSHGEVPLFEGLADEAAFYERTGAFSRVKTPQGILTWEFSEALNMLRQGSAHGFATASKPDNIRLIKYDNIAFGREANRATLFALEHPALKHF